MFDIIIVGAGTAGLSAAIYGLRAGKSVLLFDGSSYGGQIVNTPDIENYPGIKHISGYDFATGLYQQAKDLGAELRIEKVLSIEDLGQTKKVRTTGGEYEARAVILATGPGTASSAFRMRRLSSEEDCPTARPATGCSSETVLSR